MEFMALGMFVVVCVFLMAGYPVAFTLAGSSLLFALIGYFTHTFDGAFLEALPNRIFGIMTNDTLLAVPLFVFMGVTLERSKIAENLLEAMALLFGRLRGGLGFSVLFVGTLLAASTGIVGATVVTMGLIALPTMLRHGYDPKIASGVICASGTLGQIIPPSIILVLLGDVLSSAYQQAQLNMGIFSPETVSVGDLFVAAILPGLLLVGLYFVYILVIAIVSPNRVPALTPAALSEIKKGSMIKLLSTAFVPPILLIVLVLGSIIFGVATPTEAAAVGAVGSLVLAAMQRSLNRAVLSTVMRQTLIISSMVFLILIGASVFSLVFRGFGGDEVIQTWLGDLPGGVIGAMLVVMLVMFLLGFVLDFIEIIFVVVPIVAPTLLAMGLDPIWLGIMMAVNLQTSFLTPPFGFALFYLRGVAPPTLKTSQIYRGVLPFIVLQVIGLGILAYWPEIALWLPRQLDL